MNEEIWPTTLVETVARGDCVFVIGAGMSRLAVQAVTDAPAPVSWVELLNNLLNEISPAAKGKRPRARSRIASLIASGDLLTAAQAVEQLYEAKGHSTEFRKKIARITDGRADAPFMPGEAHELLSELNPRVIVTTNYDRVLERNFRTGFATYSYNSDAIAPAVRRGEYVLIKLHGTCEDPQNLVLTRLDFTSLRRTGNHTLDLLEALFLSRTALFLGYGLADPDLQLLLENQFGRRGGQAGHYMLAHEKSHDSTSKRVVKEAYGVEVLDYPGEVGSGFVGALRGLVNRVNAERGASSVVAL